MKKTLSFFFSFYLFLSASFSQIVINEVHFNPASSQGSDWNYEFFEIFNAGQSAVDLAGYSLNDYSTSSLQATYTFPTMSIEAGGYGIVSVDTAQATGYVAYKNLTVPIWRINDVSQTTDFNMGNSGGKISIYNGATLVDSVDFEAANGVSDIDGGGKSWELKDFALDNSVSSNWAASTADGGSPGAVNGNFSGTPWSSGGGGTAGGSGPVRTHAAGTWTGDTFPMINSLNAASTDTNYWQYFDWGVAGLSASSDSLSGH